MKIVDRETFLQMPPGTVSKDDLLHISSLHLLKDKRWEDHISFTYETYDEMREDMMNIFAAVHKADRRGFKIETVLRTVHIWFDDSDDAIAFNGSYQGSHDFVWGRDENDAKLRDLLDQALKITGGEA